MPSDAAADRDRSGRSGEADPGSAETDPESTGLDGVDRQWFLTGVVALLGFALVDTPATPAEYVAGAVVLLGIFAGSVVSIRERVAFRLLAAAGFLGVVAVSLIDAWGADDVVTAFGFAGGLASLGVLELASGARRRRARGEASEESARRENGETRSDHRENGETR